jgi:azurin
MNIRLITAASLLLAASGAFGADKVCKVDIAGTDQMQFDKKEIVIAPDCTEVELVLKHAGKLPAAAMGHNWVLTRTADVASVATDGIAAGIANDHVKKGDARVLAYTKVIGGGQTTSVKFKTAVLKKGEAYTYFCSFPGHSAIMKGVLKF